jgi:hypothetical protein
MMSAIRPHHILCLLAFRGKGYSEAFCASMAEKREHLLEGMPFELVTGKDGLCETCPNWGGDFCASTEGRITAEELDLRIIQALGLKEADTITLSSISDPLSALSVNNLANLCDGCSWRELADCPTFIRDAVSGNR